MTRIDPIPHKAVVVLKDKHLQSAWNEVPRVITHVENLINKGKTPKDVNIPSEFKFNSGHVKFFYDKLLFINDRLHFIYSEGIHRGFDFSIELLNSYVHRIHKIREHNKHWVNNWTPSQHDTYLGMARLISRHFETSMQVNGRNIEE